jgi:hypothetical protein
MQFTLTIDLEGAAMQNEDTGEVDIYALADLITQVAEQVRDGYPRRAVRDANGNHVGQYTIAES